MNCAALPCDLLENELFGYERNDGGSIASKTGKMEFCEKGTLVLDEITEMPLPLQAKLLQVLQSKHFLRPGSGTPVPVDVRILAASTTNVEPAVSDRRLREDLYYSLSAYTIHVPPLRERREEVPLTLAPFHAPTGEAIWHLCPKLPAVRYRGMPEPCMARELAGDGNIR